MDPAALPARMRAAHELRALREAAAEEQGLWLVGGAVRDLLIGERPLDLDVCVEGDALAVAQRFARRLGGTVEATGRFDTASVRGPGFAFDLARARRESYPSPGALPEVAPATVDEDLPRRDFTVNALAAALAAARLGELRAPANALDDLSAGVLRVFHPRSFLDDPTRLLRLTRFEARPGFAAEAETERLAGEAVAGGALRTVSGKRVGTELRLLVAKAPPLDALRRARDRGMLSALHPDLDLDEELARRALDLLGEDGAVAGAAGRRLGDAPLAALAVVCRGVEGEELRALLDRLAFPAAEREAIVAGAHDAPGLARALRSASRPSEIAAAARGRPAPAVAVAGALGAPEAARRWLHELRQLRLAIGGSDLVAAGVPEGPAVGRALEAALRAKLDGEAQGRDEELRVALAALRDPV